MSWNQLDTWIVITAALVSMACALPGVFLVLSRQSMMAHGLSHAVLPGIVVAYLVSGGIHTPTLVAGALVAGVLCATLTRALQEAASIDPGTASGISFTTLFALGLVLQRLFADHAHIEASHVLYGNLELSILDVLFQGSAFPAAARRALLGLALNAGLVLFLFKELRIATFDPQHAAAVGARPRLVEYLLVSSSAFTCVLAFESVGSILVVAMMIVPPAFASLFARDLREMIALSLGFGVAASLLGHVLSRGPLGNATAAVIGFGPAGSTNTAGGIAATAGLLLLAGTVARVLWDRRRPGWPSAVPGEAGRLPSGPARP
ncbi:MAG: metal ABC transporter permease [Planctomycetota bacterium]